MSEKATTSNKTKHIKTRYRFVYKFVEDKCIENYFCDDQREYDRYLYKKFKR